MNNIKAQAWQAGYEAGRNSNGSKALVECPFKSPDAVEPFFEGFKLGIEDCNRCAKTGHSLDNPYL